jgi:hypothetical protein
MRCIECGGTYLDIHGTLVLDGISVKDVDYHRCGTCGDVLLPLKTAEAYEQRRKEVKP